MSIFPPKPRPGDTVRVIAPSCSKKSMPWLSGETAEIAQKRFEDVGLRVTFSTHSGENDILDSSAIESRIEDLHDAFMDPDVQLIICVRGGFSSNQLLKYMDFDLIKKHPKILCGFSDITCLSNAIYAKTGLVGYSSPNYNTFGCKKGFEYSLDYFRKCIFSHAPFIIDPSTEWSNDHWGDDQEKREFLKNDGYWILQEGAVEGRLMGGNLCTLNLLHGTDWMPDISESLLFLEDDYESHPATFDRDLQSLIHQPGFTDIRGLVIGRFEKKTSMTREKLSRIISTKKELKNLPVIANADFGHTQPSFTFPIGGTAKINASHGKATIEILTH